MKVSLNWLREFLPPDTAVDTSAAASALTMVGLEVEGIEEKGRGISGVLVAEVLGVRPHPNAEKLRLVRVRAGAREEEVVCGAPNVPPPGHRVCWAAPDSRLPGGLTMTAREVRGVMSPGMLCSETELGLAEKSDGILILSTSAPHGADLVAYAGLADDVLEVNVTPNRPDALSHLGIARELAAALGVPLRLPTPPDAPATEQQPGVDVRIAQGSGCPRYRARFVADVKVAPSPLWLQLRLANCGVRPISNLVDVTNYVLLGLGHPLHAFDLDKLQGDILVRRAHAGEKMVTLDGQERALLPSDIVIADGRGAIALAGVMGGASTEVTGATRRVLLEAATFDPVSIRRTSKRLGLTSEASYRYERNVDPEGIPLAADLAVAWMASLAGGAVNRALVDRYPAPPARRRVALPLSTLRRVSGLPLTADEAREQLSKVAGVQMDGSGDEVTLVAEIPTFRPDLTVAEDLVEEVLRLGRHYASPPRVELVQQNARPTTTPEHVSDRARDLLASRGLAEVVTWGFVPRAALQGLGAEGEPLSAGIVVKNPISADYEVMRTSLLPGLLETLRRNVARGLADGGFFEVGPVIQRTSGPEGEPRQSEHAAALLSGRSAGWLKPGDRLDFYDAKRVCEDLLSGLGVTAHLEAPAGVAYLHPGVSARVVATDGSVVGLIGELHPAFVRRSELDATAFFVQVDLSALPRSPTAIRVTAPPRFPAATRDVSFWIDSGVPAAVQQAAMEAAAEPLLRELRVLEDFRDPKFAPAGHKGMLWTLVYRADERTLTDAEVDAAHARVLAALRERLVIQIR